MAIALNHSVPISGYGSSLANAAQQEHYGAMMNPYIRQFFEQEYQSGEQTRNRDWRTGERLGEQQYGATQAELDRALRERMQAGQQGWQTGESALDREMQRWQTSYLNPQRTTYSFTPAYQGPGSYSSSAAAIHQKHFGY